jgi:hypothetical protein
VTSQLRDNPCEGSVPYVLFSTALHNARNTRNAMGIKSLHTRIEQNYFTTIKDLLMCKEKKSKDQYIASVPSGIE